jgi:dihydroorotase-like cyclic amidohydrolase
VDPDASWTPAAPFVSKSRNTPFAGRRLKGRVLHAFVGGRAVVHAL